MKNPNIYQQVPNLETCMKLKEQRLFQDTIHVWARVGDVVGIVSWAWLERRYLNCEVLCAAPLYSETIESD